MPCDTKIITTKLELKDEYILKLVCKKLGWKFENGYKVCVDNYSVIHILPNKKLSFSSYLEREAGLLQAHYGLEKAKLEARKQGQNAYESVDEEGNLVLKVHVS